MINIKLNIKRKEVKAMSNYTLSTDKKGRKFITIDDSIKATPADDKDIAIYVGAGYVIRHKSEKRAKAAAKRADSLTDAAIKEALKDDKKALEEYEAIKKQQGKGGGFFAAKKWYKENFQK